MSSKRTPEESAELYKQLNDLLAGLIGLDQKLEPVVSDAKIVITIEQADFLNMADELEETGTTRGVWISGTQLYEAMKLIDESKVTKVKVKKPKPETPTTQPPTE